jgi:sugar phosphate isomerase/epimerase
MKTGITLYSATNEWVTRAYDLEGLLAAVAERGVGPGVEIVGFQTIPTFPDVTAEFAREWERLMATYDLVPTCLGSNIDVAQRSDRLLSDDEMVASLERQLTTAHILGFGVVRIQIGANEAVIERVVPTAERLGIRMGMELHAPEGARTPAIVKVRQAFERIDSPNLGFIPDFSATMRAVPPGELDQLRTLRLPDEWIDRLVAEWRGEGAPFERFGRFAAGAGAAGIAKEAIDAATMVFTMHGREPVESWRELAGRIVHVHGKCYGFDEAGDEPSIDYPAIISLLDEIGYAGWISTEWEGHVFTGPGEADSLDMVAAQQRLVRRVLAERGH